MPMRDAEVNQILNRVQEGEDTPRTLIHFDIGEQVKINGGHFEGFDGNVEEVDNENQRLKVTVSHFWPRHARGIGIHSGLKTGLNDLRLWRNLPVGACGRFLSRVTGRTTST